MCSALQNQLDACNGWEIDRTLEQAMDALRCPPPDALVANLSGGESGQQGTDEESLGLGGRIPAPNGTCCSPPQPAALVVNLSGNF